MSIIPNKWHPSWDEFLTEEIIELLKNIDDVLVKNKPVDNSNCHSTGCLEFISDNVSQKEKIVPKKAKPKEKEVKLAITEEEANEIVRSFVDALDSLF